MAWHFRETDALQRQRRPPEPRQETRSQQPRRSPAVVELLEGQALSKPYMGDGGHWLTPEPEPVQSSADDSPEFVIPPWPEEERRREAQELLRAKALPAEPPASVFGGYDPEPPDLSPQHVDRPVERPTFPKPDWRQVEAERLAEEAS